MEASLDLWLQKYDPFLKKHLAPNEKSVIVLGPIYAPRPGTQKLSPPREMVGFAGPGPKM